jgi:hypothetical protein
MGMGFADSYIAWVRTGVWPEAGSFRDDGMGPAPAGWRGICQDQQASDDAQVRCNRSVSSSTLFSSLCCLLSTPLHIWLSVARSLCSLLTSVSSMPVFIYLHHITSRLSPPCVLIVFLRRAARQSQCTIPPVLCSALLFFLFLAQHGVVNRKLTNNKRVQSRLRFQRCAYIITLSLFRKLLLRRTQS